MEATASEAIQLTSQMMIVMGVICVAVFLFIVEWVRVDVVAIIMMVALPLLGLITPAEAFVGFSSNAVISIIAVIIIGAGLDRTGLVNKVVAPVIKLAGDSTSKIVTAISLTVAGISCFMQNIGAAALFLPAIKRVSKTTKIPISRILMPVGFSAILGGTITMIGSSPLILLNDLITPYDLEPFQLFAVAPIGLALLFSGVAYFVIFGRFVLPQGDSSDNNGDAEDRQTQEDAKSWYRFLGEPYELAVPPDFSSSMTISQVRKDYMVNVVALVGPDQKKIIAPSRRTVLEPGHNLGVYGTEENVKKFATSHGLIVRESLSVFNETLSPSTSGTVEAVVGPRARIVGKTLHETHFRKQYRVTPMAIYRGNEVIKTGLTSIPLKTGDALLFHGTWGRFKILQDNRDFIFTTQIDQEILRPEKAAFAAIGLAIALSMVILLKIQLSLSLMTGVLWIILTKVITIDEAYQAVDWRTVFLLAGLIPLGMATEQTGAAGWIAQQVLTLTGDVSPVTLLTIIAILTTGFTLVISNVGATVLLVPLVVNMALKSGVDPRMAALVVGIATSNSFILPTHQVNALYMGAGRYRSVDFIKAGSIGSVIFIVVLIGMMYLFYGIGG